MVASRFEAEYRLQAHDPLFSTAPNSIESRQLTAMSSPSPQVRASTVLWGEASDVGRGRRGNAVTKRLLIPHLLGSLYPSRRQDCDAPRGSDFTTLVTPAGAIRCGVSHRAVAGIWVDARSHFALYGRNAISGNRLLMGS